MKENGRVVWTDMRRRAPDAAGLEGGHRNFRSYLAPVRGVTQRDQVMHNDREPIEESKEVSNGRK